MIALPDPRFLRLVRRCLHRWLAMVTVAIAFGCSPAVAHEMSMAEISMREASRGEFFWQWTATSDRVGTRGLKPVWPSHCAEPEPNVLQCGGTGLSGQLAIEGVGNGFSAVLVRVQWADGQQRVYTLTKSHPTVQLFGSANDPRGMGEIASAYTMLGIEHILTGIDHLMFVMGLLFLVGFNRRLVLTITAFTVAHSLTLVLSAMGWLALRSPPVEATIALSIMLVAGEALHQRPTLSRRWPALVALLFGLVHGLGFAGALQQIGLPENHLLVALLTFNLGVEIGQLLTVGAAFVVVRALRPWPSFERTRTPALYFMGSAAAYWACARVAAIVT